MPNSNAAHLPSSTSFFAIKKTLAATQRSCSCEQQTGAAMPRASALLQAPLSSTSTLLAWAVALRIILFAYGLYQDAHCAAKYTDIDYLVFTDAARFVAQGQSPYARATYRYTPALAWLLLPTTWGEHSSAAVRAAWFSTGKGIFAAADVLTGALLLALLRQSRVNDTQARRFVAAGWLLNPLVAVVSTRGSAEAVVCVVVAGTLWAAYQRRAVLAGGLLGLGAHLKLYPAIYAPAVAWALDEGAPEGEEEAVLRGGVCRPGRLLRLVNRSRCVLAATAVAVFAALNAGMYATYGSEFVQHSFLHHLTRVDHRHNFSPYSTLLYLSSAQRAAAGDAERSSWLSAEGLAFVPQLALAGVLIPLALAKHDLAGCMLAQTFAFVTFNKVCTSQYFLWYIVLLPLYLPYSTFVQRPLIGLVALAAWVATQAMWLQQAYQLEFLGISTFSPGLLASSLAFFATNVAILGVIITDVGRQRPPCESVKGK